MPEPQMLESFPADEDVIATLRQAARDTDVAATTDVAALVRGGRRRVTRRRNATLAVTAAAAVVAVLAAGTLGGGSRSAGPPADQRPTPSPGPSHMRTQAELSAEQARYSRLLADPDFLISDVQYTSPTDAAMLMQRCGSTGCEAAVLVTDTAWSDQAGYVIPGFVDPVLMVALPGGYAAVIPSDLGTTSPPDRRPVVVGADGSVRPLRVTTDARDPDWGSALLARPPLQAALEQPGALWAIDWTDDLQAVEMHPIAHQPCACVGELVTQPVRDSAGTLHVTIQDAKNVEWDFAQSSDNGATWKFRTNALYNRVLETSANPSLFATGPGKRLAADYTEDRDVHGNGPMLRDFYVSDDGRNWRRLSLDGLPRKVTGLAFTPSGDLLLADGTGLWRLRDGQTRAARVAGVPSVYNVRPTGVGLAGVTHDNTLLTSTGGDTWTHIEPGNSILPVAQRIRSQPQGGDAASGHDVPDAAVARLRADVDQIAAPLQGLPAADEARLLDYRVQSWTSAEHFTLRVTLEVHFPDGVATAWNDGLNERFVTFTRASEDSPYETAWASSP